MTRDKFVSTVVTRGGLQKPNVRPGAHPLFVYRPSRIVKAAQIAVASTCTFWPGTDLSASDILYRLRFVPLTDNVLYDVIGAVVVKVSGKSWQRFISDRFFEPLGMTSSLTSVRQIKPGEDAASPHAMNDGVLKALEHMPMDNTAPAGSLVSSAADMTRWVMTLLNKGVMPDGKRLR